MKKVIFMALITVLVSAISFPAAASTATETSLESVCKPPKKNKKRGFNYGAHAKKNKKAGNRASQKYKRSGGDLTRFKCGR